MALMLVTVATPMAITGICRLFHRVTSGDLTLLPWLNTGIVDLNNAVDPGDVTASQCIYGNDQIRLIALRNALDNGQRTPDPVCPITPGCSTATLRVPLNRQGPHAHTDGRSLGFHLLPAYPSASEVMKGFNPTTRIFFSASHACYHHMLVDSPELHQSYFPDDMIIQITAFNGNIIFMLAQLIFITKDLNIIAECNSFFFRYAHRF